MQPPLTPGNGSAPPRFRVGDLEVDIGKAEVTRGDEKIALPKLSFDLLCALINAAPAIVTNDDLLQQVWPGLLVSPESVAQRVKLLRSAIGDDSQQPRYILGVRGRGYRLVPVPERLAESRLPPGDAASMPKTATHVGIPVTPASQTRHLKRSPPDLKRIVIAGAVLAAVGIVVAAGFHYWPSHNADRPAKVAMVDRSIAVLPFVDMSEKKDQEYFADGMAEEIIDLLVKIPGLKVISRTSSFQFKGKNEDLRSIATQLGVAYVLEGSVRKSGDRLRVTAQLINSRDGSQLWSQTYDRELSDVLKMQDEIAIALVRALQIEVGTDEVSSRPALRNTEAYTLYLQGEHAADSFDQQGLEQAAGYFQRAIELDPSFAAADVSLGRVYSALGVYGFMPPPVALEKARLADERAVELDPNLAVAHAALGDIHRGYDWDWAAADRELKLALALAPNDGDVLFLGAIQSLTAGRLDEALQRMSAASAKSPLSPDPYTILCIIQLRRGRPVEAEAAARRALELRPTYSGGHYFLAIVLLVRGEPQGALMEATKETQEAVRLGASAMAYFALGRMAESDAALAQMTSHSTGHSFFIAQVYAFRGETDEALKWLERAYEQKDSGGLPVIKGDPMFKKLEGDPRYKAFLKKMNFQDD
jgi:TolB-like protein/DNA-binding winged helix-turn-helix (wHTH) protein